ETVIEMEIERELKDSYLTYAMSTIMDRALPDVRDGLKPSQRRLLVTMNDLTLRPGRTHIKCAKIVGDAMGNYHPHGDAALYGTLVAWPSTGRSASRWSIPRATSVPSTPTRPPPCGTPRPAWPTARWTCSPI